MNVPKLLINSVMLPTKSKVLALVQRGYLLPRDNFTVFKKCFNGPSKG